MTNVFQFAILRLNQVLYKQKTSPPKGGEQMNILKIDRSKPFDPKTFLNDWSINVDEQDERALALTEVDLAKVVFETTLKKKENPIKGEEKLKRLKENGSIRLDASVFQILWKNQHLIPLKWRKKTNGNTTRIFFDGTILKSAGDRYALNLWWSNREWHRGCNGLFRNVNDNDLSAVLENNTLV